MNVERSYAVVGVLEELPLTVNVLENYLPKFFKGFSSIFANTSAVQLNKGYYKPETSEYIKKKLRVLMKEEMEFYNYIKQRLHAQANALKNG
ncbi:hypothetical protein SK128_005480 [Halocaridina rubra]|uniref:Uncharacterized protein n=1 Tax=Halocaridina rubra TaxID=373956 RepID=A0AAN8WSA4_HALRR